jgi:pimeloyl-ACP methyl ester carboxylesterase
MKSSSRFFPARLMSAEVQRGLAEDVYLLKPNNSQDHSVELALTHVSAIKPASLVNPNNLASANDSGREQFHQPAVVLVHGSYQNRRLWWTESGACLTEALVHQGVDVWLLELRGHGLSPMNEHYEYNTLEDYARYDLPAVEQFVAEHAAYPVHWLGQGSGAGTLLAALALKTIATDPEARVIGMGAPFSSPRLSRLPKVASLLAMGRIKTDLELGPESEPISFLKGLKKKSHWFTQCEKSLGPDFWQALSSLPRPIHWLTSPRRLGKLDEGFDALQTQGVLKTMPPELELDQAMSQGNVSSILTESEKVASLSAQIISLIETGETQHHVLPTGKTAPAARWLQAYV